MTYILALLCTLVLAVLIATPRSGQTTIDAPRDLSELRADASAGLSGAPRLVERDRVTPTQVSRGAPQPRTEEPVPSLSGVASAISSGLASWFPANGDVGAVPWWRAGQDPVWASVCAFPDGKAACVTVLITGWCACLQGQPHERLIDLSDDAFRQLAPLSRGVIRVQMELLMRGPTLPATDMKQG